MTKHIFDPEQNTEETSPAKNPSEEGQQLRENAEFSFLDEYRDNPYNNVFVKSLATITQDDLGAPPEKKRRTPGEFIADLIPRLVFWAAVAAFLISGYQVVSKLHSYRQANDIYSSVADSISKGMDADRSAIMPYAKKNQKLPQLIPVNGVRSGNDKEGSDAPDDVYNERFEMMKGQLASLQHKSPEVIGWIRMEGDTAVNYPIVQHEDNDYYLHYAYDGTYNPAGSIYLDYRNSADVGKNRNSILYGHNMESGSPMFSNLLRYRDRGFLKNNRYIEIYTPNAMYTYEVFSAYESNPSQTIEEYHPWRISLKTDEDFLAWIARLKQRSDFSSDVTVEADDKILTLSTCTNINNNRYVVHAKLIEVVS